MTDGPIGGIDALLERTEALLTQLEAPVRRISENVLAMIGGTDYGDCEGLFIVQERETQEEMTGSSQMLLFANLGFTLPLDAVAEEQLPAIYETLALLSPEVDLGFFELDFEARLLRFRHQQIFGVGPVVMDATLLAMLFESLNIIDQCTPVFVDVLDGFAPGHAMASWLLAPWADIEDGEEDDVESPSPEDMASLHTHCFSMLRRASEQYKAAGDEEKLKAVHEMLLQVGG